MLIDTYNQKGEKLKQAQLPKEIFELELNTDLVHQVIVCQMSNKRQGTAHTKDRGDVRGGGRKPWRQKGTGRARHGSTRSPIWKGGGVTFGPRNEKNYKKTIPTKMRRKAMLMVLSAKVKKGLLIMLDKVAVEKPKTKEIFQTLNNLPCKDKSALIVLPKYDKNMVLAIRNIPKIACVQAKDLNALELLSYRYLLLTKNTIDVIKETFLK